MTSPLTKAKIGLIGIVGELTERDFWGTMEQVARIGYQGIEALGGLLTGDVPENVTRFHGMGLEVLTVSASRERLRDDLAGLIAEAHALQSPRATVWWAPCDSREAILQDAELYNRVGATLAGEGIKLCYHNHDHEFRRTYNGVCALDILAEHTDPASVYFNLDIAWVAFGGADPVSLLHRMAARVPAIHVKDFASLSEPKLFTAVGTGVVPIQASVRAALESGIEWIVIEQDTLRNLTPMETITVSYLNLKEAGLV